MKKSKFSLILAFLIIIALVSPFATYATDTEAEESISTEEVTTKTEENPEVTSEQVTTTGTETTDEATENSEDANVSDSETNSNGEEASTQPELEKVTGNYLDTNTNIDFNKAVDGNALFVGDNITIKGQVNGDAIIIGKNVTLDENAKIYGNLLVLAENLTHSGLVYNLYAMVDTYECKYEGLAALDIKVIADKINFAGYTERSVTLISPNITISDDAYILGNLTCYSNNEINKGENANIFGEYSTKNMPAISVKTPQSTIKDYILSAITMIATILFILLIVNYFKPSLLSKNVEISPKKALKALLVGFFSAILLPAIATLLLLTRIFVKIAFITIEFGLILIHLSYIIALIALILYLYNKFSKDKSKWYIALYTILISLIFFGLSIIPFVGIFIKTIVALIGLGALIIMIYNIRKNDIQK